MKVSKIKKTEGYAIWNKIKNEKLYVRNIYNCDKRVWKFRSVDIYRGKITFEKKYFFLTMWINNYSFLFEYHG